MEKTYKIANSERCYRYKWEALMNHAPAIKTIYEIVTFNDRGEPHILYIGLAWDKDLHHSLAEHLEGIAEPKVDELIGRYTNVYFDYVLPEAGMSQDDLKDIHWALIQKNKPEYNKAPVGHSGRYQNILLQDEN